MEDWLCRDTTPTHSPHPTARPDNPLYTSGKVSSQRAIHTPQDQCGPVHFLFALHPPISPTLGQGQKGSIRNVDQLAQSHHKQIHIALIYYILGPLAAVCKYLMQNKHNQPKLLTKFCPASAHSHQKPPDVGGPEPQNKTGTAGLRFLTNQTLSSKQGGGMSLNLAMC